VETENVAPCVYTRDAALADFRKLKEAGAQKVLAARWQVSEGTVSKWFGAWETDGAIERTRHGKANKLAAIPQRRALPAPH
jgi:transposase